MILMEKHDDERSVFPLTSLQIGDLQSYLSDLSLFLAIESNKLYILVDNRPWLRDLGSRPAHLWWQLMVTKSRLSPFANTKGRKRKEGKEASSKSNANDSKKFEWFCFIDAATLSKKRALLPVKKLRTALLLSSELHRTLYGFIVFEVTWSDVRGINYFNELQTDTSLAIEAKFMRRWEFDSIDQAANSISLWFSGTPLERDYLKEYLNSTTAEVFYDTEENFDEDDDENLYYSLSTAESFSHDHCDTGDFRVYPATEDCETFEPRTPVGPYKRRASKVICPGVEADVHSEEIQRQTENSFEISTENAFGAKKYRDVLLLFRFDDRDLPFKLQQIIMPDLRLLRLLEAGLPSWVIFLQSYPGFCHIYRPWMCPMARALYVLISVITVVIGFYDLYKNVPVLKATAARLCGPLFDWIETWEMVSRIKYLGTMLFLHNCQKAVSHMGCDWFSLQSIGGSRRICVDASMVYWCSSPEHCNFHPVSYILLSLGNILCPIRLVLALARFVAYVCGLIYILVGDIWQSFRSIIQLASASESTVSTSEVSMLRSLWNDIFSQVFRALRSILNGFVAFFTACNRHRLSIYNHVRHVVQRPFGGTPVPGTPDPRRRKSMHTLSHPEIRRVHGRSIPPALSF
ncbi:hypothetical protein GQ457_11G004360 [Hibiscus cannabinus]